MGGATSGTFSAALSTVLSKALQKRLDSCPKYRKHTFLEAIQNKLTKMMSLANVPKSSIAPKCFDSTRNIRSESKQYKIV